MREGYPQGAPPATIDRTGTSEPVDGDHSLLQSGRASRGARGNGPGYQGLEITQALMPPIPIDSFPANPFVAGQGSSKT